LLLPLQKKHKLRFGGPYKQKGAGFAMLLFFLAFLLVKIRDTWSPEEGAAEALRCYCCAYPLLVLLLQWQQQALRLLLRVSLACTGKPRLRRK